MQALNSKMLNPKTLSLVIVFAMSQAAWAGKLDVSVVPSPTKAFAYSLIFPGGGHLYLSSVNSSRSKYEGKGFLFLALGLGSYIYLGSELKKGNNPMLLPVVCVVGVKLLEFGAVINDAEIEKEF